MMSCRKSCHEPFVGLVHKALELGFVSPTTVVTRLRGLQKDDVGRTKG